VKYSIELDLGSADVPLLTKFNSQPQAPSSPLMSLLSLDVQ
jgi:hypothetical protein